MLEASLYLFTVSLRSVTSSQPSTLFLMCMLNHSSVITDLGGRGWRFSIIEQSAYLTHSELILRFLIAAIIHTPPNFFFLGGGGLRLSSN